MNCDVLTVVEGIKLLERNGYTRPKIPREVPDLAGAYLEQLHDLPADCVAEAFQRFVREGEDSYFPKVKKIRSLALLVRRERPAQKSADLRGKYLEWENRGWRDEQQALAACPVCDAVVEVNGRIRVNHDPQRHREAGVRAFA